MAKARFNPVTLRYPVLSAGEQRSEARRDPMHERDQRRRQSVHFRRDTR